jgi:hypothetical protein
MSSKVSIFNRALNKLGDDRVLLATDDDTKARTLNGMFDEVRDAELRRANWKFAIKRVQLPALTAAPDFGYRYQYPLPADYLAMVQVNDYYPRGNKQQPPYSIEAGRILTDYPAPLKIRYVSRVENVGLWDPLFVELLASRLAMEACETLTQSETKFNRCAQVYKDALIEAVSRDAIEKAPDELPWGTWLESRGDGGGYGSGDPYAVYPSGVSSS